MMCTYHPYRPEAEAILEMQFMQDFYNSQKLRHETAPLQITLPGGITLTEAEPMSILPPTVVHSFAEDTFKSIGNDRF